MITIYKYSIPGNCVLEIPDDAEILSVQVQNGEPQLWVKVDNQKNTVQRRFKVFGTGEELTGDLNFIGTFQMMNGFFVWHLFEVIDR